MHDNITAHCILEKISFKVILYQKTKPLWWESPISSLKYEKLESFSSATLTAFEDIGRSSFDNFAQPPMFTIAFCDPYKSELIYFWNISFECMWTPSHKVSKTTLRKFRNFFICYLATPRLTLEHCQGGSLSNPIVITALTYFSLKVTGRLVTRLGSKTQPST